MHALMLHTKRGILHLSTIHVKENEHVILLPNTEVVLVISLPHATETTPANTLQKPTVP